MKQSVNEKKTEELNSRNQLLDVKTEQFRQQILKKLVEEVKRGASEQLIKDREAQRIEEEKLKEQRNKQQLQEIYDNLN